MILLRSVLLALVLIVLTPPFSIVAVATAPFAPFTRYRVVSRWAHIVLWFLKRLCGMDYRVIGRERLPQRASIVLCKHQSAWETIALQKIFPPIGFVLKRELLRIPFFGWGLAQMPIVSIDRAAGKDALQQVLDQGGKLLGQGFWLAIFPEGTRVAPGTSRRYKLGGAYLASRTGVPVVPVAHNAGEFWRRRAFLKYPGTITVSIGPPIESTGLTPDQINSRAHEWIEAEMRRLFPHHYDAREGAELPAEADPG